MNRERIESGFLARGVRIALVSMAMLTASGCASPYMARKAALHRGDTRQVYVGAVRDLVDLGQFDVNGNPWHATVRGGRFLRHRGFFDYDLLAAGLLPNAYMDTALAAMGAAQHQEAIRHAQRAMDLTNETLSEDRWLFQRLVNLRDANLLLYRAYMATGDLQQAALCYRQHLIFSKLIDSKAGKELRSQLLCIRMASMRLRSENRTRQHWSNLNQILQALAAVANAAASHRAAMAVNLVAIAAIEQYKQALHIALNADLNLLLSEANSAGERMRLPPGQDDLLRAKRASDLYNRLRIRVPLNPADQVDMRELDAMLADAGREGLLAPQRDGSVVLRAGAARFITAAAQLDRVPLSLPPVVPNQEDEWLDAHLTPGLYRLAGVQFSAAEKALLDHLSSTEDEVRLHPSTESGRQMILALRKLERQADAYRAWRNERGAL